MLILWDGQNIFSSLARRVMTAPYLQHDTASQSRHAEPIEPRTNEL